MSEISGSLLPGYERMRKSAFGCYASGREGAFNAEVNRESKS